MWGGLGELRAPKIKPSPSKLNHYQANIIFSPILKLNSIQVFENKIF